VSSGRDAPKPLYIDEPRAAERFLDSLAGSDAVALDTEGASFHRFVDRIYLLQVSTRSTSAVLDPLAIGKPEGLRRVLEDKRIECVFHDADYDIRLLHQDYAWHATNIFDTRVAAQLLGLRAFSLAALVERYFGVTIDKKHQRADWSMRPLSPAMLDYAAQDTMYLLGLRDRLREELERAGRWSWAAEEFQRLEGTRWDGAEGEPFLRVKGARDLSRRELAILRELVRWRDGVARELDRATFRVVGNEVLLDVARQAPRTADALRDVKGMPRGIVERRSMEILAAIDRALALPEEELPKFPKAPRWDRDPDFEKRVSLLRTARDAAAERLGLDPGFLCSRERLEAIARRNPATLEEIAEVKEMRRWQVAEIGPDLLAALRAARAESGGGREGKARKRS